MILGSGYTATRVAIRALEDGWRVVVTTRHPDRLRALEDAGAHILEWDILQDDVSVLAPHMGAHTVLLYSIPTLFRDDTGAPHMPHVHGVLQCANERGVAHMIYLSSTSVYGDHGGARVDEETALKPTSALGRMRGDIERAFMACTWTKVSIARIVGIYGPNRTLFEYTQRGKYQLVDGGKKKTNRVHVEDIVQVVWAMIHRQGPSPRIFNVCDGHPVTVRDLVSFLVEHTSMPWPNEISMQAYAKTRDPSVVARWKNGYVCDARRMVHELGITVRYPSALDGYRAMLEQGVFEPEAQPSLG